ncbi:S-adenosyl-L-methionine-dependent methyltransferase [Coniochaeta hoffmannii]|uniref:S-adenosyl-L-methionine-dependent methyltransferase n=1 Tax=Coniochaeta hoffmannii TaxID=91930 RepID=A0AA38VXI6_9PEZI|nr:S-adenosyl-L-methionine-dependent methyltransferase [Coniochaeta hoffmannii]
MAGRSGKPPKPPKAQASSSKPPPFSKESFEKELEDLAAKAKDETWINSAREQTALHLKAAALLLLMAIASNVSQLNLSPVYGSIPSSIHHEKMTNIACFLGWSMNRSFPRRAHRWLPVVAAYIPLLQFYLFSTSSPLGATWGPVVTELLTLFPLTVISVACVANYLEEAHAGNLPSWPGLVSYGIYKLAEYCSSSYLSSHIGSSPIFTRLGLQAVLFLSYTLFSPSKLILYTLPAVLHFTLLNTHVPSPFALSRANSTLLPSSYNLLARKESLTGYISVLENTASGFRVLRCDHSLLGGEWVHLKSLPQFASNLVAEPIYGVFAMLEAVRLVVVPDPIPDAEARALVVGMGIGTTPAALVAHGIATTVVEIDPVVVDFAHRYFALPDEGEGMLLTTVVEDAVAFAERESSAAGAGEGRRYDYIVHDVFTGGAEPVPLFTLEFLQSLAALLEPGGVVAINYAGDFALPPPAVVAKTIREVFPSCRVFREHPRDEESLRATGGDFANMVFFCTKSSGGVEFREAREGDLLNSPSREQFLTPKHEVLEGDFLVGADEGILTRNDTKKLEKWHRKSAVGHWGVMRNVLPKEVWENW